MASERNVETDLEPDWLNRQHEKVTRDTEWMRRAQAPSITPAAIARLRQLREAGDIGEMERLAAAMNALLGLLDEIERLRAMVIVMAGPGWHPISTALYDTTLIVRTEAGVVLFASKVWCEGSEETYWVAEEGHPYPASWSDGRTWDSNADEEPSDMPAWWMPLTEPGDAKVEVW